VTCAECDFSPEWTDDRGQAERWAAEHTRNPDRDVSGIWGLSRWRVIDGINHAFPFGTAVCGAGQPEAFPPDGSLPLCPVCDDKAPADRVRTVLA
jgi:hypothetical protein